MDAIKQGSLDGHNPEPVSGEPEGDYQRMLTARRLIAEAIKPGKRAEQRVRFLDLVQLLGGPLGPTELFELRTLLRHRSAAVREKAEETITAVSPCGIPNDPRIAALMRAVNPLLSTPPPPPPPRRTRMSDLTAALRGDWAAFQRRARSSAAWQKREERERRKRGGGS